MNFVDVPKIKKYVRAANYISAIQIYLQNNFLLEAPLDSLNIKPRLLGHWGTCPGINFVYANLNSLAKRHNAEFIFLLGPGHGFPALQANLFLEGTLQKFYPEAELNEKGLSYISKNFSWPHGFPSHSNPGAPGVILEGGELGYSLSTAYGAILDNPDLIAACLIGDGEAETGPLATSWHINKFIDPKTNGAVLPILHLNGYKISGPTVFGRMSTVELRSLFYGYGYEPYIVEEIPGEDIYKKMVEILEICYEKIRKIQDKARSGMHIVAPNWPMIILRTPKGWTGPKKVNGEKIEDNYLSHQVVASNAKTDERELRIVEDWLKSYKFEELFSKENGFDADILDILPDDDLRLGINKHTYPSQVKQALKLPQIDKYAEEVPAPGFIGSSSMRRLGEYFKDIIVDNDINSNFRIFSPDETYSNKIDKVFEVTNRSFIWPTLPWDKNIAPNGRVIEVLSEHSLFGLLQGYILTGRYGLFISYEAFVQIVSSMTDQFLKFMKVARTIPWRQNYSSLNIILTSSGWRQDHNGFSHQNPGFIGNLLEKQDDHVQVYFPADGNTTLAVMEKSLKSQNGLNVIVAGKTQEPRWLNLEQARKIADDGIGVWDFISDDNPDLIFIGIGDYVTKEIIAAIKLLKNELIDVRIRFVNIVNLNTLYLENINDFLGSNKPIFVNFHGYPESVKKILFERSDTERFEVRGYIENGSTTSPYDMHVRNRTSRWHIILWSIQKLLEAGLIEEAKAKEISAKYNAKFAEHKDYIITNGVDLPEIEDFDYEVKY